jgi:hypothetical protein
MTGQPEFLLVDETLPALVARTGLPAYDFDFRTFFPCRPARACPAGAAAVARVGAFENYEQWHAEKSAEGVSLLHTPEEHLRCSQLPHWYPLISDLTPRSRWYADAPGAEDVEREFGWPVFVKGGRQTSRHRRSLSIVRTAGEYRAAVAAYRADPILRWQTMVVREFVPLRPVEDGGGDRIPASFEFRTFWWRGRCVGAGRYWWDGRRYDWAAGERREAMALAGEAARRLNVGFLVVDVAMTALGRWVVIECNDGQESGYAGVAPLALWANVLAAEAGR